jgi:4-diphosphocytidyl-2-C-methyl-D-erythritol kinase
MFTTQAPAKINLDLRIVETYADGYHALDTVFQSVALGDELTLERATGSFTLICTTPGVPIDARNLAWRGAEAVATAVGASLDGWRLRLVKRVPAEAGLGGGSADAVAAARLVLAALGREWDAAWLADLLAPIGSDVPYFVHGGTMRGRGRGDRLERLPDVPLQHVVIVRPDVGVSTRDAYAWFDAQATGIASGSLDAPAHPDEWRGQWVLCRNDLHGPVAARLPVIDEALARLGRHGAALALMSGSGSAVFGLFPDDAAAVAAAATDWPDAWQTWVTHTVDEAGYRALTTVRTAPEDNVPLSDERPVV